MKTIEPFLNVVSVGDSHDVLKELPDNSIDSVVTDPPYGLSKEPDIEEVLSKWLAGEDYVHKGNGFMGKSWDSFVPGPALWREVYRTLKPGGHALVFAGTRTQDLMTIALRMAGFEVRDVIEWLYLSGFPKNMNVSKRFDKLVGVQGEVIGEYQYTRNNGGSWTEHATRGSMFEAQDRVIQITAPASDLAKQWEGWGTQLKPSHEPVILVRKPLEANVCDTVARYGTGAIHIDACRIGDEKPAPGSVVPGRFPCNSVTLDEGQFYSDHFNVSPDYCSKKASKKDRNSDWKGNVIELPTVSEGLGNFHPTVKPTALMRWLVRLITPPQGIVLDPFCGSGTTATAAKAEGFHFVTIEREENYAEIAKARVS